MNKNPAEDKAEVKLVPCATSEGLKEPGGLSALSLDITQVDEAFGEAVDQQIAQLFNG